MDSTESGLDLVCYRSRSDAPTRKFTARVHAGRVAETGGVRIEYVHQCPLVLNAIGEMSRTAAELGLAVSTRELATPEEARAATSPFGTFGVFLRGEFLTHGMMGRESFSRLLEEYL